MSSSKWNECSWSFPFWHEERKSSSLPFEVSCWTADSQEKYKLEEKVFDYICPYLVSVTLRLYTIWWCMQNEWTVKWMRNMLIFISKPSKKTFSRLLISRRKGDSTQLFILVCKHATQKTKIPVFQVCVRCATSILYYIHTPHVEHTNPTHHHNIIPSILNFIF